MGFPTRSDVNQNFISSRQLLPGSWANGITNGLFSSQSLLAAGTTQADAALANAAQVEVLAGSANNAGVKLPVAFPGAEVALLNNSANTTKVYGTGTDVVQTSGTTYAAAATGITMATLVSARFFCIKAGFWQRIVTA